MIRLLCSLFFLISLDINSHEFNPAHLVIEELTEDLSYEAMWMYPYKNIPCILHLQYINHASSANNLLYMSLQEHNDWIDQVDNQF